MSEKYQGKYSYEDTLPSGGIPMGKDPTEGFEITEFEAHKNGYRRYLMHDTAKPEEEREIFISGENVVPLESYDLSEHDRTVLKQGLMRLLGYLNHAQVLPTMLIFPDTTARPLFWATEPVIRDVYKTRGLDLPKISFLSSSGHFLEKKRKDDLVLPEEAALAESDEKRLAEFIEDNKNQGDLTRSANILVIDDYVHKGSAYRNLGGPIKKELQPGNFMWFSFLASTDFEEEEDMIIATREDRSRPDIIRGGFDFGATSVTRANVTGVEKRSKGEISLSHSTRMDKDKVNRKIVTFFRQKLMDIGKELVESHKTVEDSSEKA